MSDKWPGWRGRLPRPLFSTVSKLVPISCVDVLPYREVRDSIEVGLIRRKDPFGALVWTMVGGGIHRRESIAEAASRHITLTLGPNVRWEEPDYSSPDAVGEYFPVPMTHAGFDPRKHAIALTYAIPLSGPVSPNGEALDFHWFSENDIPFPEVGFRQADVIRRLLPLGGPNSRPLPNR